MSTSINSPTEVLHSENHSKLTDEEIAKALARHNKHHPDAKAGNVAQAPKVQRAGKK